MTNVFVAPKIKVGFQKRTDTFTGQLAYIIYYDEKGKIRKEKSWEGWRDKKITPQEFDNAPMDGFTLNKDVKRYSGEWFSSHRTMIRVHDPRGFEFEVTTENLIGILMHTDCLRRGLIGQFVYAWVGPELVLLPTNSEEYQAAVKYTGGLAKKVSAKALVPGVSYKTKREGDVIFLGKFNWYEYSGKNKYSRIKGLRGESKVMVFTKDEGKTFFKKTSAEFLAEANSDQPVSNFAELVEKFNKKSYANKVVRLEFRPVTFNPDTTKEQYYGPRLRRQSYFVESSLPGVFVDCSVQVRTDRKRNADGTCSDEYEVKGYEYSSIYHYGTTGVKQDDGELVEIPSTTTKSGYGYYSYSDRKPYDLAHMQSEKFYDLYVIFENNKQKRVNSTYELTGEDY
jgi:hypothetical protein